jgi:hypothetical protein
MRIFLSFFLLLIMAIIARADFFELHYYPSTIKLTATQKGIIPLPDDFYKGRPTLRAARGEWESLQIVITAGKVLLKDVRIEAQDFKNSHGEQISKNSWVIFRENYVQIPYPSARYNATVANTADNTWWPDALIPQKLQPKISIKPGKSEAYWLTIRVPENTAPGYYLSHITILANDEKRVISVPLQVEHFAIPAPTMRANVAVYYDVLRDWYTKNIGAMSDAQFAELKKEYYDFLLKYRINAYDLPVPWNSSEAAKYINNPKVLSVRLPPLSQKKELETAINVLKKNHAMAKGYYYWIDEPSPDRYPEIIDTEKQLNAIDPAIKQCVTIAPNKILDGSVDIWCPNIGDFLGLNHLDVIALTKQRDKGRETWWYTMVEPKYPYPTWLVDDEALSVRRYGGLMAKYGISGFVYSMAHGWGPDPLHNIASFAGTYGDGTLVYPSELVGGHGPMPSIRLMLLRDAMEDYELMKDKFHISLYPDFNVRGPSKPNYDVHDYYKLEDYFQIYPADSSHGFYYHNRVTLWARHFDQIRNLYYAYLDGNKVTMSHSQNTWKIPHRKKIIPIQETTSTEDNTSHVVPYYDPNWIFAGEHREIKEKSYLWTEITNLTINDKYLKVAIKVGYYPDMKSDWVAVQLSDIPNAPPSWGYGDFRWVDQSTEDISRWRFIITGKGKGLVERQTSAGRELVDSVEWKRHFSLLSETYNQTHYYEAVFEIPRDLFPALKTKTGHFRINFIRHYQWKNFAPRSAYFMPNFGDIMLMPEARIVRKSR